MAYPALSTPCINDMGLRRLRLPVPYGADRDKIHISLRSTVYRLVSELLPLTPETTAARGPGAAGGPGLLGGFLAGTRLDLTPFVTSASLTAAERMTIVADFGLAFEQWRRHALMYSQSSASEPRPNPIGQHTFPLFEVQDFAQHIKYFQYRTPKRHMVNSTADVAFGYTPK